MLEQYLVWLVSGGAVVAVSWLFEEFDWFQSLEPKQRKYLQFGLSALIGILALLVTNYVPKEVLEGLSPYFEVLAGTFGMIFLNQAAHTLNPNRKGKG